MIRHTGARALLLALCFLLASMIASQPIMAQTSTLLPSLPSSSSGSQSGEGTVSADQREGIDDLIRILETEATRNRLIETLKASAYQAPEKSAASETPVLSGDGDLAQSVPAHLASYTRSAVAALQDGTTEIAGLIAQAGTFLSGAQAINLPRVWQAILPVSTIAIATLLALAVVSWPRRRLVEWLGTRAKPKAPVLRLFLAAVAMLADALTVIIAVAAGHATSLVLSGGPPDINEALFLNAFALTELVKVGLAAFVAPFNPPLRLTPFSDGQARYWYRRLALVITLLGYIFLFVAPVVQSISSIAAGNAVRFLVVTVAYLFTLWLVLANRERVKKRLQRAYREGARNPQARVHHLLGQLWWLLAACFISALFALWISSPRNGFQFMLAASLMSIAAMAIGGLVVSILTKIIARGIRVSAGTSERFPLLERRINGFIPKLLLILRIIVIAAVIAVILHAWSIIDLETFASSDVGRRMMSALVGALVILTVGFGIHLVFSSWVEYRLNPNFGSVPTARERTLLSLFRNALTIALALIVMMLVLSQIGINIAPLLAGAGVVGLAVGFGAQKLVQDIITGAFIQIENALNEGDVVQLGSVSGVVEKLTIRSVSLRSLDGTYHLIPFSSVDQVANMTKDFSNFVADVSVAYREKVDEVKTVMLDAFDRVRQSPEGTSIIADFEMLGVETLGDNAVVVRGRVRTLPGKQWGIGRLYREVIKELMDERGIEIPFPQTTVWFGETKSHEAPPLRLAGVTAVEPAGGVPPIDDPAAASATPTDPSKLKTVTRNFDGTIIPPDPKEDHDDDGDPSR
ncbi:mechanosensitive ion channel domain-containing protein [Aureimonas phyllosphaerae]|uniref:Small conductance mechanosensitive channel n=1 Tax=Aureimonas phyllosphaerae TaxID=1166078 RepID=A0A7W6FUJ3_9HYPH|nr:mechanosensitive ion channel domain-containing protein [Aureimonas phyllosphaerae]MBB3935087.1 small conductance mechanosensitive channel [Aureimonas phyllosphaerae]MBB3959095.1 small conductance mechanosensitive channel [Aureimonas phyllosphaerae]SFF08015.1 small conductance mechanosensitive channel [Aureimonas phyllosphaerae]